MDETLQADTKQNAGAGGSEDGVGKPDPLSALERRWDRLAVTIRDLRDENAVLLEQLSEQEERVARMEVEAAAKVEEVAELTEEKRRTILRIENLLTRFDDLGS